MTAAAPLLDGIVFLSQYFGTAVERAALASAAQESHASAADRLARCCARAGLVATPLDGSAVRAAMLPAIVSGINGTALVVLQRDGDGFECHLPGVAGTRWLDGPALERECPDPSWHAVPARLVLRPAQPCCTPCPRPDAGSGMCSGATAGYCSGRCSARWP